jgi:hypothetical protein
MIIPKDATIAIERVRDYLLTPQEKGDKSGFLALAGYTRADYWELLRDLRDQLLPGDAEFQEHRHKEDIYVLRGILTGPNGERLAVRTVWVLNLLNEIRFVTLLPDKARYHDEIRTL